MILVVTLLSTLFAILVPWPMKVLIDSILGSHPMHPMFAATIKMLPGASSGPGITAWLAIAGLVIFAISGVIDVVLTHLWIRVGQGMVYDLAGDLFARVQRRSLLFHTRSSVGDSMARITGDSWCIYAIVDTLVFTPLHAIVTSIAMFALMYRLSAPLTLLSLAVSPVVVLGSVAFGKRLRGAARAAARI